MKAGLEKEKAAVLVVLAALSDGRKELITLMPGHRESTEGWSAVLRDLKARGLAAPKLMIGDGHLGIWAGLRNVYPTAKEQRCWNHRIVNALDKVPKTRQAHAGLAIFIAALGLFALSVFTTERRTKEIGIRKAMGAGAGDILRLLLWEFTKPVLWQVPADILGDMKITYVRTLDEVLEHALQKEPVAPPIVPQPEPKQKRVDPNSPRAIH